MTITEEVYEDDPPHWDTSEDTSEERLLPRTTIKWDLISEDGEEIRVDRPIFDHFDDDSDDEEDDFETRFSNFTFKEDEAAYVTEFEYPVLRKLQDSVKTESQEYGLGKTANEATIVIEAYKTLRDRGPFLASQVVRDLGGNFAFVLFDSVALKSQYQFIRLYRLEHISEHVDATADPRE
ncbi:hypothetical protein Cni_G16472 [Canna indica]|uniref:DUF3700 domain-containing protein n=1 Tax=Canna indica TaxID=4628 RepID=A0AAQ3QGT7_9LILI|nr:hypothetical protein Cni_G16472 [Canna indica]